MEQGKNVVCITYVVDEGIASYREAFAIECILKELHDIFANDVRDVEALVPVQENSFIQGYLLDGETEGQADR